MVLAAGERECRGDAERACVLTTCGDGDVDAGEACDDSANGDDTDGCTDGCEFSCEGDADCDDANRCNGMERCELETHTCESLAPLDCDDGDPCTRDECAPLIGCSHSLQDTDGDGAAPSALGACGLDCNDEDRTVFEGAEELCDGLDNDCDEAIDETAPNWYADCDGDGFASAPLPSMQSCEAPSPVLTGCGTATEQWVALRPVAVGNTDCDDTNAAVHPAASESSSCDTVDSDCDGEPNNGISAQLSVALVGSGTVTSIPTGIACGGDCTEEYPCGTEVVLDHGASDFTAWGGDCVGDGETCRLTMDADRSALAIYTSADATVWLAPGSRGDARPTAWVECVNNGARCEADTLAGPGSCTITCVAGGTINWCISEGGGCLMRSNPTDNDITYDETRLTNILVTGATCTRNEQECIGATVTDTGAIIDGVWDRD